MISGINNQTPLNGLVLAGGKSTRMGFSKDRMEWHGKEQRYYVADLLAGFCDEVFISCRAGQEKEWDSRYQMLPDTFLDMGPMGGLLSALRAQRDKALLVIACDLPLLNEETIRFLVAGRNPQKIATAYESPVDRRPEPLVAIWEPESYPVLLDSLGQGITSLRDILTKRDTTVLTATNPEALMNVNTPGEAARAKQILDGIAAGRKPGPPEHFPE